MEQVLQSQKDFMAGVIWLGMAGKYLEHNEDTGLVKEMDLLVATFKGGGNGS